MHERVYVIDTGPFYLYLLLSFERAYPAQMPSTAKAALRSIPEGQLALVDSIFGGGRLLTIPPVIAEVDRRIRHGTSRHAKAATSGNWRPAPKPIVRILRDLLMGTVNRLKLEERLVTVSDLGATPEQFIELGPVDAALFHLASRERNAVVLTGDGGLYRLCQKNDIASHNVHDGEE